MFKEYLLADQVHLRGTVEQCANAKIFLILRVVTTFQMSSILYSTFVNFVLFLFVGLNIHLFTFPLPSFLPSFLPSCLLPYLTSSLLSSLCTCLFVHIHLLETKENEKRVPGRNRRHLNNIKQKTGEILKVFQRNTFYIKGSTESQKRAIWELKENVISLTLREIACAYP